MTATAEGAGGQVEAADAGSLASRAEKVMAVVLKQPLHREIHYKTLGFCRQQRSLTDVENEIATYPEFKHCGQDQYHLISFLTEAGGLERIELDEDGGVVTEERKAGLSEDEIDDLVASYAYVTTDAGVAVFEEYHPRARMSDLLESMPERTEALAAILEFCKTSRAYTEIEEYLEESGIHKWESAMDEDALHPSSLVGSLEKAGALVWDDGWLLTEEGSVMLESIRKES